MSKLERVVFISAASTSRRAAPSEGLKPSSVVYWSRFFLAIAAALIAYSLRLRGSEAVLSVAIAVYIFSVVLVRYALGYGEDQLKGRYRHVTLGAGTFIFVWLSVLVLMYTIAPY